MRFIVAGDGECRAALERLALELKVAHKAEFVGQLPPAQIAGLLQRAAVFVTTSTSDGNNISLNEAMACGSLPVASDIPANREWIVGGRNGLLFPVHDAAALAGAVLRALADVRFRLEAAKLNQEIILERGCWQHNMQIMEQHYHRLLLGRRVVA